MPISTHGAIQTRLLYTYGFRAAFMGMYYENGMHSNNAAFLLSSRLFIQLKNHEVNETGHNHN